MLEATSPMQGNFFSDEYPAFSAASKKQQKLLEKAIRMDLDLSDLLHQNGMTYEDLRYVTQNDISPNTERYHTLDDFTEPSVDIPVVSFFSGCGGLDLGFEAAGFSHSALIEHTEIFCNTIRHNRPDWSVIGPPSDDGDVSDRDALHETLRKIIGKKKFEGVFVGGPPCQPFSIAANQRFSKTGSNFKRTGFAHEKNGNLLFDYVWFIQQFKPRAFLIENVTGLMELDGGKQLGNAISLLTKAGYKVETPFVLKANQHHVPQQRQRLFVIGSLVSKEYKPLIPSQINVNCSQALTLPIDGVENHVTRKHKAGSIYRYMQLRPGERDKQGRVDRLDPNQPSKTVIAGGSKGGGRSHLHPFIPRTLSVRESARLQTFPDSYVFTGSHARQFTQVGNAVPPVLGAQLAKSIKDSLF